MSKATFVEVNNWPAIGLVHFNVLLKEWPFYIRSQILKINFVHSQGISLRLNIF